MMTYTDTEFFTGVRLEDDEEDELPPPLGTGLDDEGEPLDDIEGEEDEMDGMTEEEPLAE